MGFVKGGRWEMGRDGSAEVEEEGMDRSRKKVLCWIFSWLEGEGEEIGGGGGKKMTARISVGCQHGER